MITETEVTKDPRVELMELKLAVTMFCHQMETCAILFKDVPKNVLQIQIESEYYNQMKEKSK